MEAHGIPIDFNDQCAALTFARNISKRKKVEAALQASERLFRRAFSISPAMMSICRVHDGMLLETNEVLTRYTGYRKEEIIGRSVGELGIFDSDHLEKIRRIRLENDLIDSEEVQYKTRTGERRYALYSELPIEDHDEQKKILSLLYDVTKRKMAEELLRRREEESNRLAKDLEEANVALRVVLSRREEDQTILEEKIQYNVNEIVLPFIRSLKNSPLEDRDKQYLSLLEANLKSILSPFMRNMSNTYKGLTPKEMQIAEMIRQGKDSKDIAEMLCTSVATVHTHRNNIRKKLMMNNQKTNLRSYLISLS